MMNELDVQSKQFSFHCPSFIRFMLKPGTVAFVRTVLSLLLNFHSPFKSMVLSAFLIM